MLVEHPDGYVCEGVSSQDSSLVSSVMDSICEETTGHGLIQEVGQRVRYRHGHPSRLYLPWPIPGVNISYQP